ncbi:MAG: dienelactone hydrolase family protein [Acetobacteraceae bacterium]|nr:dienelactone hydrolase family protein [Acetobacteraceae bacterium]
MGNTTTLTAADGHSLAAYEAGGNQSRRGLVVIQEIFGINHHIRNVCDRLAGEGYAVAAPALFDRVQPGIELNYTADDVARGRELRARVPEPGVIADVGAAWARMAERLGGGRIGIIGFCWGGTVAWWGATRMAGFAAASCWYGGGIAATRTETPRCPVQMHFGEKDASIPLSDVEAIRAAQPGTEIYVYPGAQHGFGCNERASYSKPEADLAWERSLAFFVKHLGS